LKIIFIILFFFASVNCFSQDSLISKKINTESIFPKLEWSTETSGFSKTKDDILCTIIYVATDILFFPMIDCEKNKGFVQVWGMIQGLELSVMSYYLTVKHGIKTAITFITGIWAGLPDLAYYIARPSEKKKNYEHLQTTLPGIINGGRVNTSDLYTFGYLSMALKITLNF
jgi:hypothetical protein